MNLLFISDTHGLHDKLITFKNPKYLKGDEDYLLIHAGDITEYGTEAETNDFLKWFAKLPCKHKIFIGGNHDLFLESCSPAQLRKLIPEGVIYLINSGVTINGYKIWGSPVTPYFLGMAFNKKRGQLIKRVWNKIPLNTDILITHGPPNGILDGGFGCEELLTKVKEVLPSYHLFGHAHEHTGIKTFYETTFVNRAAVNSKDPLDDKDYKILAEPIHINLRIAKRYSLKTGVAKEDKFGLLSKLKKVNKT